MITTAGQRDQENLATFHLDAGRRAFEREADREAIQELRRALYLSPYLAEAHLLLGRLYPARRPSGGGVEALKIALWSEETVAAHSAWPKRSSRCRTRRGADRDRSRAGPRPEVGRGPGLKAKLGGAW
jgi:hypothetical protein